MCHCSSGRRALQRQRRIDRELQIVCGDVPVGAVESGGWGGLGDGHGRHVSEGVAPRRRPGCKDLRQLSYNRRVLRPGHTRNLYPSLSRANMKLRNHLMRALSALAVTASCAAAGLAVAGEAPSGNIEAARDKVSMCIGCHGIPGYKASFPEVYHVPMIAGQNAKYIEAALREYASGARTHPTMDAIAKSLSDQDIADLAAYYANLK